MQWLHDIVTVRDHRRTADGLEVVCWNGFRGLLSRDTPDFASFEALLRHAHEIGREGKLAWAVGLEIEPPDRILLVGHASPSPVMGLTPGKEPGDLMPRLAGHPFDLYLKADHPEYERIRRTLLDAFASGAWVWYALYAGQDPGRILDVRRFEAVVPPGGVPVRLAAWRAGAPGCGTS